MLNCAHLSRSVSIFFVKLAVCQSLQCIICDFSLIYIFGYEKKKPNEMFFGGNLHFSYQQ